MFQELVVSGVTSNRTHKRWTIAASGLAQAAAWGILILVPLLYTEALPNGMLKTLLVAPPSSAEVVQAPLAHNTRVRIVPLNRIAAPTFVPRHVESEAGEPPVEYVERGDRPAGGGDALPDLFHATTPLPPPAPPAEERRGPLRVSEGVEAASIIRRVLPQYPEIARAAHVSGTVVLHAIIARDGTVQELAYVSGPPLLIKAAIDAVKQWRYRPTLLNGSPVEVETTIDVMFTLGN